MRFPRRNRIRWIAFTLGLLLCGWLLAETLRVVVGTNRHTVLQGRIYRCSQQNPDQLRELVQLHKIRTVINLRGVSPGLDWYTRESQVLHELNVSQEDVTLSANRLPPPAELRRLIEILDQTEYPVLIHCKQGADRTGLASCLAVLLYTHEPLEEARKQLWPVRGHVRFGRTAAMDDFFALYEQWLTSEAVEHQPDYFRQWANTIYTPGPGRSELRWLDSVPVQVKLGEPVHLRLQARNTSQQAWEFQPGDYAGIHLGYRLADPQSQAVHTGIAGLFRRTVLPGESIVLDVVLPPQHQAGKYVLIAELHDARGASVPIRRTSFVQLGDDSLMAEIVVE